MSIGKEAKPDQSLDEKADAAFLKASEDVVAKAAQTGTDVIIWRDNRVVRLPADEATRLIEERRRNGLPKKTV